MADPFVALKVGPYSCYCTYGGDAGSSRAAASLDQNASSDASEDELSCSNERDSLMGPSAARRTRARAAFQEFEVVQEETSPSAASSAPWARRASQGIARLLDRGEHWLRPDGSENAPQSDVESSRTQQFAGLATSFLARISVHMANDEPDATPEVLPVASQQDILPRRRLTRRLSLTWVDKVLRRLWPKVDEAIHRIALTQVQPRIQEMSPALKGLYFKAFTLGKAFPTFGSVQIWEAPVRREEEIRQGVELHLDVVWEARSGQDGVHIELADSFTRTAAGVSSATVKGKLVIRLDPLLENFPIVGGVVAYFLDPPTVEVQFEGLARIADFPFLQGTVRSTIDREIANTMVLPNVLHVPLVKDEAVVDSAVLRDPKPLGVLRVTAVCARDLVAVDWHMFSGATSDPYLRLMLSADEWQTRPMYKTCNPDWPEDEVKDFVVYDREQLLRVDVHDWGRLKTHDLLGRTEPVMVLSLLDYSDRPIPLFGRSKPGTSTSNGGDAQVEGEAAQDCGDVTLRFQWLRLAPEASTEEGAIVRVKLDELYVPSCLGEKCVAVCARVGAVELTTKAVRPDKKLEHESFVFEVERVLNLALPAGVTPDDSTLVLEVLGSKKKVIANAKVHLKTVTEAPKNTRVWPRTGRLSFSFMQRTPAGVSAGAIISLEVEVSWLGLAAVSSKDARREFDRFSQEALATQSHIELPYSRNQSLASESPTGAPESLEWVNRVFDKMWPKVVSWIQVHMENPDGRMNQKLQAKMPDMLRHMRFSRFELGRQSPVFELVQIRDAPERLGQIGMQGIEMHVAFTLGERPNQAVSAETKDRAIEIDVGQFGLKFAVRSFYMTGELVVRLEPLLSEAPVVGGIVMCCLNRPQVDLEFQSAGARVVDNVLEGNLRSLIDWGISSCLVMPNVIGFAIGGEEQGVDRALLHQPKLLGVLRISVLSARVWRKDETRIGKLLRRLFCSCRRNMKLRLTVADELHSFDEVPIASADDDLDEDLEGAEVGEALWDFPVYDLRQELEIELLERCGLEAVIAKIEPVAAESLLGGGAKTLELRSPAAFAASGEFHQSKRHLQEGEVTIKCEHLETRPGTRGSDEWSMLRVKVDEVYVPAKVILPDKVSKKHKVLGLGVYVAASVAGVEKVTPMAKCYLREEGAKGSGKTESELRHMGNGLLELEVEFVLWMPLRNDTLQRESLHFEIRSKAQGLIGSASLALADVLQTQDLRLTRDGSERLKITGLNGAKDSEMDVVVNIVGLAKKTH